MEITAEALPGDLCHDKFEQEMDTVVNVNVSVKSEEDAVPIVKRRGRPKKIESPVTDGKTIEAFCTHFINNENILQ